jgi:hypothetical protein
MFKVAATVSQCKSRVVKWSGMGSLGNFADLVFQIVDARFRILNPGCGQRIAILQRIFISCPLFFAVVELQLQTRSLTIPVHSLFLLGRYARSENRSNQSYR